MTKYVVCILNMNLNYRAMFYVSYAHINNLNIIVNYFGEGNMKELLFAKSVVVFKTKN